MNGKYWSLVTSVACTALLCGPSSASAQAVLGTAQSFAVLGGSAVTNTGATTIVGNLGVSPGAAVTGFPPGLVTGGTIHAADAVALQAQSDVTTAYNFLASQAVNSTLTGTDLGGLTLIPGVYFFSTSAQLTGILTLDAQGDPNAVFIFQIGSTLTTATNSSVVLINGAQNCNVFWQVGSSATLGTGTAFVGNILALTSITLTTGANASGRALARNGAVTLDDNAVAVANCAAPPTAPTLSKAFVPATINAGGPPSTLTITLSNPSASIATLSASFTDNLPSGVTTVGSPSTTCGGSGATATPSSVTLPMGSTIPTTGCTVTVDVTAAAGIYLNTILAGALQTDQGNNAAPAAATLAVNSSVTLSKAFSPAIITAPAGSTLTITLGNNSGSTATLSADLTDNLPSGVTIVGSPSTTCGGSGATATASSVTLPSGSTIPAAGCTVTVNVTAAAGASYLNELPIGALRTDKGSNAVPTSAALLVNAAPPAPTLSKAFSPSTIDAGGPPSTLTITLINPSSNPANLTTTDLVDTLPTGVQIATSPNAINNCGGGAGGLVANANGTTVTLLAGAGNSIPATSFCTVTVDVTAANAGIYSNTIGAGALVTSEGNNIAPASATLAVIDTEAIAPTLSKLFSPLFVIRRGDPTLTITLCNNNGSTATLTTALTDNLPSGMVIATPPVASTTCGGGTVTATAGGSTIILPAGSSIPPSSCCTVTVHVLAAADGTFVNTLPVNALQTTNGNNLTSADATLTVKPFPVPMLSGWAMILLPALLGLVAFATMRRQAT